MVESRWRPNETAYDCYSHQPNLPHSDLRNSRYQSSQGRPYCQHPAQVMLRTRQFPEVAGIYGCEEQPSLRRFTRYGNTMMDSQTFISAPPPSAAFSKSGNWTFRDRKHSRPGVFSDGIRRDERPMSMNFSEQRAVRSKSENSPRQLEVRVPMRIQKSTDEESLRTRQSSEASVLYKTNITVDDAAAILRPKKNLETNNNRNQLRKSCPDLDAAASAPIMEERGQRRRNRRAKEKIKEACWRKKPIEEWALDDVLLWLQACSLDDVASLLIGYDIRGTDLLTWDDNCLSQLGVTSTSVREKILGELAAIRRKGPEDSKESEKKNGHRALFDIVKQSTYDQVLAVETPLTTRDIIVTHGRLGCLQIIKINGANLPLRENDCLLEINDTPGEQFKSALMLTKLISDSYGAPIRFVVLRMKTQDRVDDSSQNDDIRSKLHALTLSAVALTNRPLHHLLYLQNSTGTHKQVTPFEKKANKCNVVTDETC
ncbi:unnamed protein product [Cylicocyclus nassatus]|uniref:SAM domain-containing protein n=1 Tax=Cylicocyclus nassatus TaxID=53992 RepID=A0AA36GRC7_CYLNA|nr:unnamed protein product [Cylicocyclus nassatus]